MERKFVSGQSRMILVNDDQKYLLSLTPEERMLHRDLMERMSTAQYRRKLSHHDTKSC